MIQIKCASTGQSLKLTDMKQFQGNLKKRSDKDTNDLMKSLTENGLLMPFAIWVDPSGVKNLLDGHGRLQALMKICMMLDPEIINQEFPVLVIDAPDEAMAKKYLLEIDTKHGKVTPIGLKTFTASMPQNTVPVAVVTPAPIPLAKPEGPEKVIVRLRIPKDKVAEFTSLMKTVSWIEVY
jgi:hypothetical protein